jgi:YidC/Oxa1 family membrane protein insertase
VSQKQDGNSFLGPRNIIAIALAIGILIGWQLYMQKKYGTSTAQKTSAPAVESGTSSPAVSAPPLIAEIGQPEKTVPTPEAGATDIPEKTVLFDDATWKIEFVNRGMAFKSVELKKYRNRQGQPVVLGRSVPPYLFQTTALGDYELQSLNFDIERKSETEFVGTATAGQAKIIKTMRLRPQEYAIDLKVDLIGSDPKIKGLRHFLVEDIIPTAGASLLNPALDFQTTYVAHSDGSESKQLNADQFKTPLNIQTVHAAAVGQHYFATGIVDQQNRIFPQFFARLDDGGKAFIGQWDYVRTTGDQNLDVAMKLYAGPKSVDLLKAVDEKLVGIVDYGWFGWLARPMLWLMNILYGIVGNYGFAIILLTLIVRLMVLPLHMSSYKSMKSMAAINPQMQAIREKYKADPQRVNMEIMALMKNNKVNPVGGCLPMLLQLPVFFALYRVLGNSIELYQAPFILWIHDLSLKDPFYVLPVLMGIVMFIQQKITPSTMDPAQQKVFMIMPVVFAGMMISLPSGLTLYIFVSTLFGIVQQIYFMDKKAVKANAVPVKAGR